MESDVDSLMANKQVWAKLHPVGHKTIPEVVLHASIAIRKDTFLMFAGRREQTWQPSAATIELTPLTRRSLLLTMVIMTTKESSSIQLHW
jgi:hypothetical protein